MKRRVPVFVLSVAAVLLVIPSKAIYDNYQQAIGRRDAEIVVLKRSYESLLDGVRRMEKTKLAPELKIAYKTKVIWDTLPPLIPDLLKPDAKPVPAAVLAKVIFVGREAVESCHAALSTCLVLNLKKDTIIANQQTQIGILEKRVPGRWDAAFQWGTRGLAFWLGTQVK